MKDPSEALVIFSFVLRPSRRFLPSCNIANFSTHTFDTLSRTFLRRRRRKRHYACGRVGKVQKVALVRSEPLGWKRDKIPIFTGTEIHLNVEGRGFSPARVAVRWFTIVLRPVSSMPPFPLLSVGLDLPLPLDLLEEVAAAAAAAAGPTCMFIVPPPPPPKPAARQDFSAATITGHEKCLSALCVGGAGWRRKKFFS